MPTCLIGLGANLGDRLQTLEKAVARLAGDPNLLLIGKSRWHTTSPIGGPAGQPTFLNGAITLETSLAPRSVAEILWRIETELGRKSSKTERTERWGPRAIDLDLLLYGELTLKTPSLVLPHPRMAWRRFVLEPAGEVAAAMVHPTTGWTIARLLDNLDSTVPYVAIAGPIGVGKTLLARRLTETASVRVIREEVGPKKGPGLICRNGPEGASHKLNLVPFSDPTGQAWATELEFLDQRARLLAADNPQWSEAGRPAVSDFWFDQSLAFAGVWLSAEQFGRFQQTWEAARCHVVRPRLIVLLDAPSERLAEQIARRGRRPESRFTAERLEQIRRAILAQADKPDQGPLLRLADDDPDDDPNDMLCEARAAMEAML